MRKMASQTRNNVGWDFCPSGTDLMVVVCYCCDLMWVTGCPTLTPVNTSSERRRDVAARGRGRYFD